MTTPVDWTDPCQRAKALTNAYYSLLSGEKESTIRTRSGESEDEVRFAATNIDRLKEEMQAAEDACLAKQGLPRPRRRFAIQAGSRPFRGCL